MKRTSRARVAARIAVVLALVPTVLGAAPAAGEEPTRDGYVAAVEPICKANVEANRRIFKGAKAKVKAGRLKSASGHFFRAATAFTETIRALKAVPRPAADEEKLGRWFGLLAAEADYIRAIGTALAQERRQRAESISVQLDRNSTRTNNAVLGFGFEYCRIDPARFG
jgi:hypothetical protein